MELQQQQQTSIIKNEKKSRKLCTVSEMIYCASVSPNDDTRA